MEERLCFEVKCVFFLAVAEKPLGRLSAFIQAPPTVSRRSPASLISFKVGDICASKVSVL